MSSSVGVKQMDDSAVAALRSDRSPKLDRSGEVPLSFQLASHRGIRVWLEECVQDSPSWLVSLILHLVAFLLIASVAVPWTPISDAGSGTISLTMGFSDQTQASQGPTVTLEPAEARIESSETDADPEGQTPMRDHPAASARPQPSEPSVRSSSPTANRSPRHSSSNQSDGALDAPSVRVSRYAALLNRRRPFVAALSTNALPVTPLTELAVDPLQRAMDQIVDDFIAYDVGRLRGTAGQQARARFARLGPEALPALVRGLNKAAGIHASCPVGVIAGKLIMTLRSANDPSLREYAIQHVGQGVPDDAPHYHRLAALRKNWLGAPSMPRNVEIIINRLEEQQEGELMELMLALSDAPSDTMIAALRSGDEYLAAAATLAIIQGPHVWDGEQRGKIRAAMMHFQTQVRNPQIRGLTVDAQRVLTR